MDAITGFPVRRRGSHRIYLGYAVGVGKTYAMLQDGLSRSRIGEDVVVGLLEAHSRSETAALAAGIERLPLLEMDYRGARLAELDVEAARLRRPGWLLVDELAHTNVCASPCEKRWESVETLLEAGISVMSTMNIQHLESLSGFTLQVTGVNVDETVPDAVLAEADEIVLVDIEPDDLISRIKQGKVCSHCEAGSALTHFFRRNSLAALRGEALRIADRYADRTTVCSGKSRTVGARRFVERLRGPLQSRIGVG
jgi:two-component system sensor histidine kinase KdpD